MARVSTTHKVYNLLKGLRTRTLEENDMNLTQLIRSYGVPHDYGQFIIQENFLIKKTDGKRGPATYIWNRDVLPSLELANKMIDSYNNLRKAQEFKRRQVKPFEDKAFNKATLVNIERMLVEIKNHLGIQ